MEIIDQLEQGPRGVYSGGASNAGWSCCASGSLARRTMGGTAVGLACSACACLPCNPVFLSVPFPRRALLHAAGSLGFISFNDTFDLNIVIRTAVLQGDTLSIGAGGAIVVQSGACGRGCSGGGERRAGPLAGWGGLCLCFGGPTALERKPDMPAVSSLAHHADPEGEYEEMRLKARALLRAIGECDGSGGPAVVDEGGC